MHHDIYPNELQQWTARGARIIDVREPGEYASGHIPGAQNIPLGELPGHADDLSGPVVLVCASGNRSSMAAEYLTSSGVKDLANLLGGTSGWIREGRETE